MAVNKSAAASPVHGKNHWMRSSWWDLTCISFAWLPFYLWFVYGLGLGGSLPARGPQWTEMMTHLNIAILLVLGFTYIHRHYTLLLVYGEPKTFAKRSHAYIIAPLLVLAFVYGASQTGFKMAVVVTAVLWNIWHVIMQRYGFMRIYAGRVGAGLETRQHGRLDFWLTWSLIILLVCIVALFRETTFAGYSPNGTVMSILNWIKQTPLYWILPVAATLAVGVIGSLWIKNERAAQIRWRDRLPRLSLLVSTLGILAVFIISGPIVGYLTFGTAHALEYIAFVHHYGHGRYPQAQARHSLAGRLFGPFKLAPFVIGGLGLIYYFLLQYRSVEFYAVYYTSTSLLHFLYDGWIWKVRQPEVARPLGAIPA